MKAPDSKDVASVELTIPVRPDFMVLARLTAATAAARVGFGLEDIEDLRLAVEELCLSLARPEHDGRLHLRYLCEPHAVIVDCRFEPTSASHFPATSAQDGLSARILDALVDDHGRELGDGCRRAWLCKRRGRSPAS